jgi:two-component system response regulator AtoC
MEPAGKILVVDDEPEALENCRRILRRLRFDCMTESDPRRALDLLVRERPELVLTDLRMPGLDGMDVLTAAKRLDPRAQVVLMTAYATVQTAVSSMREGAFDFLTKPFSSVELEEVVRRALMKRTLRWEEEDSGPLIEEAESDQRGSGWSGIIGHSPAMREVLSLLAKIAPTTANVLIYGESGTGKELTARAIHARSARAGKPFVPVDCVSLTESLLETELFGHEKGSFTGAVHAKPGLFEMANGGTIFLDEVSGMSTGLQARLLRVLQERQVRPVGGTRFVDVDVRVLAASNQDLEQACARGEFRSDLFYRLNVIQVSLPPLRARLGDVGLLADEFLRRIVERNGRSVADDLSFDLEALELLEAYAWPGNVRELQNVVERAAALTDGPLITAKHLPERLHVRDAAAQERSSASFKQAKQHVVKSFERGFLLELLKRHRGHITQAAREAGVDRKTIERMLKRHGLREPR